jgi:hypothetical protein
VKAKRESIYRGPTKSDRYYLIEDGGKQYRYPSVTTILSILDKPALVQWAANSAIDATFDLLTAPGALEDVDAIKIRAKSEWRNLAKRAADHGTRIHELADQFLRGEEVDSSREAPEVQTGFSAFLEWFRSSGYQPAAGEMTVCCHSGEYAGTLDQVGAIGGKVVILDFKTTGSAAKMREPYREVRLQMEAYAAAHEEMTGHEERVTSCLVIYLGRDDGSFKVFDLGRDIKALYAFGMLRQFWAWANGEEK